MGRGSGRVFGRDSRAFSQSIGVTMKYRTVLKVTLGIGATIFAFALACFYIMLAIFSMKTNPPPVVSWLGYFGFWFGYPVCVLSGGVLLWAILMLRKK